MARYLLQPSSLILIAANLVPLVGVIFWNWDAFILLMLYWLETAVIAFWTVVRIATLPRASLGDIRFSGSDKTPSPLGFAMFVTLHAGIFMLVHFLFLWELFSGDWSRKIHGLRDFVGQVIVATGLWVPLLTLFIARGLLMTFAAVGRPAAPVPARTTKSAMLSPAETVLFGLYPIVMQVTIILGAWFAMLIERRRARVPHRHQETAIVVQIIAERFHRLGQAKRRPRRSRGSDVRANSHADRAATSREADGPSVFAKACKTSALRRRGRRGARAPLGHELIELGLVLG